MVLVHRSGNKISDRFTGNGPDDLDRNKNTRMNHAAQRGDIAEILNLFRDNANPDIQNHNQDAPVHTALLAHHSDAANWLIEKGANPNLGNANSMTAVHLSARAGNIKVLKNSLKKGGNPNLTSKKEGWNAAHFVAKYNQENAIDVLIEAGVSLYAKDKQGNRPVDLATDPVLIKKITEAMMVEKAIKVAVDLLARPAAMLIHNVNPDPVKIKEFFGSGEPNPVRRWVGNRKSDVGQKRFGYQR